MIAVATLSVYSCYFDDLILGWISETCPFDMVCDSSYGCLVANYSSSINYLCNSSLISFASYEYVYYNYTLLGFAVNGNFTYWGGYFCPDLTLTPYFCTGNDSQNNSYTLNCPFDTPCSTKTGCMVYATAAECTEECTTAIGTCKTSVNAEDLVIYNVTDTLGNHLNNQFILYDGAHYCAKPVAPLSAAGLIAGVIIAVVVVIIIVLAIVCSIIVRNKRLLAAAAIAVTTNAVIN
jgi:hypothetical protein